MRVLFDTSVLVAALVRNHVSHAQCAQRLRDVTLGSDRGLICSHTFAELYSVLTTLPSVPRMTPSEARSLIRANIASAFEVVELHRTDYLTVIDQLADAGFAGGIVFDALIVSAARESAAEQIVTLNPRHFHRIAADLVDRIMAP